MYILFDASAAGGVGAFDAEVLSMDESLADLKEEAPDHGGGAIYEFDKVDGELINERWVEDVL